MPRLSVIFPAFNEAENLARFPTEVLPELDRLGVSYEVLVIDDGSTDDTARVARNVGRAVRLVSHSRNSGLGAAIRTGIAEATGDLVITMDTDLTFSPTLIAQLVQRFDRGDVDVVLGSPKLAGYGAEIPSYRILISRAATVVYSLLLGRHLSAVSPIFRLYRRADLVELPLHANGFEINAEILFHLLRRGCRVTEVPTPLTQRIYGTTKLSYPREIRRHVRLVATMANWRMRDAFGAAPRKSRDAAND